MSRKLRAPRKPPVYGDPFLDNDFRATHLEYIKWFRKNMFRYHHFQELPRKKKKRHVISILWHECYWDDAEDAQERLRDPGSYIEEDLFFYYRLSRYAQGDTQ